MSEIDSKIAGWMLTGETGSSSMAMASHLTGRKAERYCYPSDGGDLGRCIKLLDLIPELRPLVPTMAQVDQYWAALVLRWANLEASWRDPASDTYALIQSIIEPVENADPNVMRFDGGATLRFRP